MCALVVPLGSCWCAASCSSPSITLAVWASNSQALPNSSTMTRTAASMDVWYQTVPWCPCGHFPGGGFAGVRAVFVALVLVFLALNFILEQPVQAVHKLGEAAWG